MSNLALVPQGAWPLPPNVENVCFSLGVKLHVLWEGNTRIDAVSFGIQNPLSKHRHVKERFIL